MLIDEIFPFATDSSVYGFKTVRKFGGVAFSFPYHPIVNRYPPPSIDDPRQIDQIFHVLIDDPQGFRILKKIR